MSTQLSEAMQRLRRAAATRGEAGANPLGENEMIVVRAMINDEVARSIGRSVDEQIRADVDKAIADQLPAMVNAAVRTELSLREQRSALRAPAAKAETKTSSGPRLFVLAVLVALAVAAVTVQPLRTWLLDPSAGGPATWLAAFGVTF